MINREINTLVRICFSVKEMLTSLEVFKQKVSPSKRFYIYLVVVGVEILEDVDADDDKELDVDALKTMIYMTIF